MKLSYVLANTVAPNVRLPDIIGTITRAQSSPNTTKCMREISEVGQFVCNSSKSARFHENGILKYAQTVTELDVKFLEQIRDEAALGMDAFDMIASIEESTSAKQVCSIVKINMGIRSDALNRSSLLRIFSPFSKELLHVWKHTTHRYRRNQFTTRKSKTIQHAHAGTTFAARS